MLVPSQGGFVRVQPPAAEAFFSVSCWNCLHSRIIVVPGSMSEFECLQNRIIKCNILEVFFVKKDCIGDELVLISDELAAY